MVEKTFEGIDFEVLKHEQLKLSKNVILDDSRDFGEVIFVGAFSNVVVGNKIISAVIVVDNNQEIIEQKYFVDRVNFPYSPEFRAYRELPAMITAFQLLEQKPEVIFMDGLGINHVRLGIASHFSMSTNTPSIAITDNLSSFVVGNDDYLFSSNNPKLVVGKSFVSKVGSKPLFISPGSLISVDSAFMITKKFVIPPHKLPEPMRAARKYVKKIQKEISK
ncbi:hypothetical protein COU61_01535 [Candidatus Pacearchaeota archaeon CG10_big_fil_rev_8_21_14_0_10_35_13]|nr:MAG: hypothetical protein COU61_01535 [Candidatus Pacearchaeota archaeon CG10_big_fil_rev_8_21_14_0_10_35_13]